MNTEEIYQKIFGNDWPSDEQLVEYATNRHGYMGDDGYYGVTYPSDLDDYQKVVDGEFIENNHVEITYWDGASQTLQVSEIAYLSAVKARLKAKGKIELALVLESQITAMLAEQKNPT